MNPEIDFKCKQGKIVQLKHRTYPWSDKTSRSTIRLGNEVIARRDFYNHIYDQIQPVLPYLFHGYSYSLRQLVLPWVWTEFDRGNCIMAGKCFIHMVCQRYVPFELRELPSDKSGTRHYYFTGRESTIFDFGHQPTQAVKEASNASKNTQ